MENLNPYDESEFRAEFEKSETLQKIKSKYRNLQQGDPIIIYDKFPENYYTITKPTPRHQLVQVVVPVASWYYLNYLNYDCEMVDLGCGFNFFKPFFPNLIGVGAEDTPETFFGDKHDYVDDEFYKHNKNSYESVFSINSLHFHPLEDLRKICINFADMIKPGGRGYLALNFARLKERTISLKHLTDEELLNWCKSQFDNFPFEILVLDIDFTRPDSGIDGNIRVVFAK